MLHCLWQTVTLLLSSAPDMHRQEHGRQHQRCAVPASPYEAGPATSTYTLATRCLVAQLTDGVPAHQVLVQLQQEVWHDMQQKVARDGADATVAYLPALSMFAAIQADQTVLLMAQNGLSGLYGDCCLALVTAMEEDHVAWMHGVFGTDFLDEMEVLADLDSTTQLAAQP